MATPTEIISASLRKLGVYAAEQTPSAANIEVGRIALNAKLDSWNTEGLIAYATSRTTKVLTAGDNDYTIGSGGNIDVTQPTGIRHAGVILSGGTDELPVDVLTRQQWAELSDKSTSGTPCKLYFQRSSGTQGTIYLYYVPNAADTLVLYLDTQLTQVDADDVDTDYGLPAGYLNALIFGLAIDLAPEFNRSASAEVIEMARQAKASIKRLNMEPIYVEMDAALQPSGGIFDIYSGGFSGGGGYGN